MVLEGRRVLYISYNGMLDPLGQSQVIPYLRELAKQGVKFTLLSFERNGALESDGRNRCRKLDQQLAQAGVEWHWLRYHQRPSLPATTYDVIAGVRYAQKLVRRNAIELVHARSHIPATIGLALKRRLGVKLIFDLRGLMAEEYVDADHWRSHRQNHGRVCLHRLIGAFVAIFCEVIPLNAGRTNNEVLVLLF